MKIVTICDTEENEGFKQLKRSCNRFNLELEVIHAPFTFGGQMPFLYEWCKANHNIDYIYTDAFDTYFVGDIGNIELPSCKMFMSAEKNCYPNPHMVHRYPHIKSEWKFVNGGGHKSNTNFFVELWESQHEGKENDQLWLAECYLRNNDIKLDSNCILFQTLYMGTDSDFSYDERFFNKKTNSYPCLIHGNGRSDMSKAYKL